MISFDDYSSIPHHPIKVILNLGNKKIRKIQQAERFASRRFNFLNAEISRIKPNSQVVIGLFHKLMQLTQLA
jgi:hypothetical protein